MPSFCSKCGELADRESCGKCGEKVVPAEKNIWKDPTKETDKDNAPPSAFVDAIKHQQAMVTPALPLPRVKEKATALYNFIPQDPATQLRLTKGDELEVIRKDSDGWWFVIKDGEKGLVPGAYVKIDNPTAMVVPDAAILAAREASNQRFMEWSKAAAASASISNGSANDESLGVDRLSLAPVPPVSGGADAKAHEDLDDKPKQVRKLKKCFACKETILGRTKMAKGDIFHEICLLCRGCREPIEEDEDYELIKKKAYHAECAKEVKHCRACDKEILGRAYKVGNACFHKLCMICSVCNQVAEEGAAAMESEALICKKCIAIREEEERQRREAERKEREAREAAERAAAKEKAEREAALAAERAKKEKEERERLEREAREKAEREAREKAEREAKEKAVREAEAAALAAAQKEAEEEELRNRNGEYESRRSSVTSLSLDQFDLGPTNVDVSRLSEISDLESDFGGDYSFANNGRDSLRLSQVLDVEPIESAATARRNSRSQSYLGRPSATDNGRGGPRPYVREEEEEYLSDDDEDREMCGGCGQVLEGEAVGALNQYFHYDCFKCSHCRRVIAEDDGYAEKDNMAFHQDCYQARFGKKCCRCSNVLKGKVVKALDNLYHPDCFVCYQCSASLSGDEYLRFFVLSMEMLKANVCFSRLAESFFEHEGQAVCARCKHNALAYVQPTFADNLAPIGSGTVGYQFDAMDETQLTIYPGEQVAILQKDDDGWWIVELNGKRGFVPGSYLVEHPAPEPTPPAVPGLCSECSTQNPAMARFCRTCGNKLLS